VSVLPIEKGADNPILRKKGAKVQKVTKTLQKLIKDMHDTVKAADGAGLAAPQIGRSLQLCLALIDGRMTVLVNPKITSKSDEMETEEEGCLSLPGLTVAVTRPVSITVQYMDVAGKTQERRLERFDARAVQHEVDHLNGVLLVDYPQKK